MPKGDKYIRLINYLNNRTESFVAISFKEIEKQVGDKLPTSAYRHRAFWSKTLTHSVAFGWLDAGYKTNSIDFNMQLVTFKKE